MKKIVSATLLASLLATGLFAEKKSTTTDIPVPPSVRLTNLASKLPPVGQIADAKSLGLAVSISKTPPPRPSQDAPSYNLVMPADLDRRSTHDKPWAGKYPGMHLNLPLKVQRGYINYLFISDQPERIKDDRKRTPSEAAPNTDPGPGATGIYARSPIPAQSAVRTLVDHTNGTKRNLNFWLVWIPHKDGFLTVRKRSVSVHKDSVAAGSRSFVDQTQINVEPRVVLEADKAVTLVSTPLKPEETVVVHLEHFSSSAGHLAAVVGEENETFPPSTASLDQLPVLHSIVWKEEQERLHKFIDPKNDPTRYNRILETFQHARGHFQFPDRLGEISYKVPSWKETDTPVQVYSLFESIPGVDVTVKKGEKPTTTDNRGKYGARVGLKINLDQLPPGCQEAALLVYNRGDVYGGRHWVSDGKRTAFETYLRTGAPPGLLKKGMVCNLWQGKVNPGDSLTMWTEPMANTSVQLWYLLVPIPPGS